MRECSGSGDSYSSTEGTRSCCAKEGDRVIWGATNPYNGTRDTEETASNLLGRQELEEETLENEESASHLQIEQEEIDLEYVSDQEITEEESVSDLLQEQEETGHENTLLEGEFNFTDNYFPQSRGTRKQKQTRPQR